MNVDDIKARDCRDYFEEILGQPERQSGKWNFYCCPFHDEHTPSFGVAEDGFHCFGCGKHGDVIQYYEDINHVSFHDAIEMLGGETSQVTPEMIAQRLASRRARINEQIRSHQLAIEHLRTEQKWIAYHEAMNDRGRELWAWRGVPKFWQDYWELGYSENYKLWRKEQNEWFNWWSGESISIPLKSYGGNVNQIKHRFIEPPDGRKYHQEYYGAGQHPFICDVDRDSGMLILVEGEIKSQVTFITMNMSTVQCIGLPSMKPEDSVFEAMDNYEPIYFVPDPDAFTQKGNENPIEKIANRLGVERVRVVQLAEKIDDAINAGMIDKSGLIQILKMGRSYA